MRLEPILAYVVFSVVTSVTPGPNNVMLTATGANVGIRRGIPHLLGITFGFGAMLFLLTAGLATALTENATLMLVLKIGGTRGASLACLEGRDRRARQEHRGQAADRLSRRGRLSVDQSKGLADR